MLKVRWIRALVLLIAVAAIVGVPGKSGAAQTGPIILSIDTIPLPGQLRCSADVTGGTGVYTYQWTPTPVSGGGKNARYGCSGQSIYISLTVTDSNGASDTYASTFYCGGNPQ
ncbi:MAG TPA: hypothetical protein VLR90_09670 [Blastocatellia bacterium]|nr:hypothetical protein [Blastocatellia bacterium]